MNKQERGLNRWKRIKSAGLKVYLFKTGLLYYGVSFFLIWIFLVPFIDGNYTFNFIYKDTFKTKIIIFGVISPIFGLFMGYVTWKGFENKYRNM